jgi:hypothetical protein
MVDIALIREAITALDGMECPVTDFEANVLETMLRQLTQGRLPSPKQHRILCEMVEAYLEEPDLLHALQTGGVV